MTHGSIILFSVYLTNGKGQSTEEAIKAAQVENIEVMAEYKKLR